MKNKPSYTSFLRSFMDIDGLHVCYDRNTEKMYKEKNLRRNRMLITFMLIIIFLMLLIMKIIGVNYILIKNIIFVSLAINLIIIFLRYFFVDFNQIQSIEEANDTKISNLERLLIIPFWGLLIVIVFI